jgi:hypothetical protein
MIFASFPSDIVISTARPDRWTASQASLLNLLVKDDKGNMHQIMLEVTLVVPGSIQNLILHKRYIENGHMVFFPKNQSGIVLNKEPKFRSDDIKIPFVAAQNGLQYLDEYILEGHPVVAMVAQRTQKPTHAEVVRI